MTEKSYVYEIADYQLRSKEFADAIWFSVDDEENYTFAMESGFYEGRVLYERREVNDDAIAKARSDK